MLNYQYLKAMVGYSYNFTSCHIPFYFLFWIDRTGRKSSPSLSFRRITNSRIVFNGFMTIGKLNLQEKISLIENHDLNRAKYSNLNLLDKQILKSLALFNRRIKACFPIRFSPCLIYFHEFGQQGRRCVSLQESYCKVSMLIAQQGYEAEVLVHELIQEVETVSPICIKLEDKDESFISTSYQFSYRLSFNQSSYLRLVDNYCYLSMIRVNHFNPDHGSLPKISLSHFQTSSPPSQNLINPRAHVLVCFKCQKRRNMEIIANNQSLFIIQAYKQFQKSELNRRDQNDQHTQQGLKVQLQETVSGIFSSIFTYIGLQTFFEKSAFLTISTALELWSLYWRMASLLMVFLLINVVSPVC